MRIPERIKAPSIKELYILRFMIFTGLAAMSYLLYNLVNISIVDNALLFSLLILALLFSCLKFLHEWYHYFYITVPVTPTITRPYTVDIFTTFCAGEPYNMMVETLTAIQAIKYPHTTYLCDEADDPYLKSLCIELGIIHVTRILKINAKAGNINNALEIAKGEICVILDPDHVPFPNFLDPIIGHFNNPEVGFVQIVQAYKNFHEGLIATGAAQQTFQFYGPMMMTMNKYGTVLAIGANCTFRRSALDSIGGHAPGLAEDMHTAMQLHAKGWKSVYVPEVLARGLVPSTLSAYYSQQLKWSRGVFELLVTSYPKLYKQFTWRQKIHYGIIPFYYLSGIIFLINFLIPVFSLFFQVNPIRMDFNNFIVVAFPLFIQIILIRNYVQRWVMEDEERGFHIVGGLLMIGTWWIFIGGLIYTLIRKNVPYVPTPKDGNEENNWPLNIPNIIVLIISLIAIIYGLFIDWNPYTFIMAGLAGINCLILLFNIVASRQMTFRKFKERNNMVSVTARHAFNARKLFRGLRIRTYALIRSSALFLTLLTIGTTIYIMEVRNQYQTDIGLVTKKKKMFLTGIFAPETSNGLSSVKLINSYNSNFDIISLYIPWGSKLNSNIPLALIDSIYTIGSIPMITWEPWQNLFDGYSKPKDEKVFKKISNGDYDPYLTSFAQQIKNLDRPVYIRFAHEADNPFYPWSESGGNTPADFKKAWKYVHQYFNDQGAFNVIWVWNPWKPEAVNDYFPGKNYVDWIGVTNLDYSKYGTDKRWYSMEDLYSPFHNLPLFKSGIPVMLAETGSLQTKQLQNQWFNDATVFARRKFPEIKALVIFNSSIDLNVPANTAFQSLNWRVSHEIISSISQNKSAKPAKYLGGMPKVKYDAKLIKSTNLNFNDIKGISYSKGLNWLENYNTLRNKDIKDDFKEIKQMGFNTIKRYGPTIYDDDILLTAKYEGLKINYGFYIPDGIDFLNNKAEANKLTQSIVSTIKKIKNDQTVIAWSLGNTTLQKLENLYDTPELIYHQFAYAAWLSNLISQIKSIDNTRPITVDVEASETLPETIGFLKIYAPGINRYGLVFNNASSIETDLNVIDAPYYLSMINAGLYLKRKPDNLEFYIADWQDQERNHLVTFDGLKDNWGKNKESYYLLRKLLNNTPLTEVLPRIKILRPAVTVYANAKYKYHALVEVKNQWKLADNTKTGFIYKWYLVKTDGYGNGISIKYLSTGTNASVKIPPNHKYYQLYLNASLGNDVTTTKLALTLPLIVKPETNFPLILK